jgi:thiamine biosynthesis lipoprotein
VHLRAGRALASPLRLTVSEGAAEETVDRAWLAIRDEFAAVDRAMSRFRADSEISALHRDREGRVSPRLRAALALVDRARRMTGGSFDAGVILDLERLGSVAVRQGWSGAARARERRAHGIERPAGTVSLMSPIDLGGIGKGLALRWAASRAERILGGAGFLLEAGGDIASRAGVDAVRWSIAIEDPAGDGGPSATCLLETDGAIATSSARRARWRDPSGREVHHLIDPRTGEPGGGGLLAVTVAAADPAWAEVWSKALFVEGPDPIGARARSRGLAAWWIEAAGGLSMTPAARQRTTWVRAEARAS